MNTLKEDSLEELKDIIEKNEDARRGYANAAEHVESAGLKRYFARKAEERNSFNNDLRRAVGSYQEDFAKKTSFLGDIHRGWMDLKSLFSANDEEAMLEESIRGDKAAIEEYDDVLEEELPIELRDLLLAQRAQISSDVAQNRRLEDLQD